MVVVESWIGAEVETASEGGVCHSWRSTATTRIVSAPSPNASETSIVRTKWATLALRHHVTLRGYRAEGRAVLTTYIFSLPKQRGSGCI